MRALKRLERAMREMEEPRDPLQQKKVKVKPPVYELLGRLKTMMKCGSVSSLLDALLNNGFTGEDVFTVNGWIESDFKSEHWREFNDLVVEANNMAKGGLKARDLKSISITSGVLQRMYIVKWWEGLKSLDATIIYLAMLLEVRATPKFKAYYEKNFGEAMKDPANYAETRLQQTVEAMRRALSEKIENPEDPHDLVLKELRECPGLTMYEIARRLRIEDAWLVLRRLEWSGHVEHRIVNGRKRYYVKTPVEPVFGEPR